MPKEIRELASGLLSDPVSIAVDPVSSTVEAITQEVYFTQSSPKAGLLVSILKERACKRTLVFTRTKHGANRLTKYLVQAGLTAAAIHGNKSQNARTAALESFRAGQTRVLVATDLAARGIDIDGITHVVNFDIPNVPETYVHRIGRTGRAGMSGEAIALCNDEERGDLVRIERLTGKRLTVNGNAPPPVRLDAPRTEARSEQRQGSSGRGGRPQQGGRSGRRNPRRSGTRSASSSFG
jgi:ATP-dependent RNA helicase RhlE